ncbi:hypothetical protein AAG906_003601 [Vitis piasezkii]
MGRPPCCDKVGIKKGPWTPEEDIILVSYIQEHGPGNWRSVPTNTGLLRCSKSCRLRWTNYLRPGIKRGNFTPHEEGMIIHLQALLGNKWAAIASYLPQRTDNDIKNYWNTHLKKKIKKFQSALSPHMASDSTTSTCTNHQFVPRSYAGDDHHRRGSSFEVINGHSSAHPTLNSPISTYASSTENISRLLEGWMRSSPKATKEKLHQNSSLEEGSIDMTGNSMAVAAVTSVQCYRPKLEQGGGELVANDEFDSILEYENLNDDHHQTTDTTIPSDDHDHDHEMKMDHDQKKHNPPLSFLEKWLLDESAAQGEEMMDQLSPIF